MCDRGCTLLLNYSTIVQPGPSFTIEKTSETWFLANTTYFVLPQTFTQIGSVGIVSSPASSVPTNILNQSSTTSLILATATSGNIGLPSSLPGSIGNPFTNGTIPSVSPKATLIQFAFERALDYEFVVTHPTAIDEIFLYLPQGVAYAMNESVGSIFVQSLVPYNSAARGYITTIALCYVGSSGVSALQYQLAMANSKFYNYEPSTSPVFQLVSLINTSFPLLSAPSMTSTNPACITTTAMGTFSSSFSVSVPTNAPSNFSVYAESSFINQLYLLGETACAPIFQTQLNQMSTGLPTTSTNQSGTEAATETPISQASASIIAPSVVIPSTVFILALVGWILYRLRLRARKRREVLERHEEPRAEHELDGSAKSELDPKDAVQHLDGLARNEMEDEHWISELESNPAQR